MSAMNEEGGNNAECPLSLQPLPNEDLLKETTTISQIAALPNAEACDSLMARQPELKSALLTELHKTMLGSVPLAQHLIREFNLVDRYIKDERVKEKAGQASLSSSSAVGAQSSSQVPGTATATATTAAAAPPPTTTSTPTIKLKLKTSSDPSSSEGLSERTMSVGV
jgi:hypothetical protein